MQSDSALWLCPAGAECKVINDPNANPNGGLTHFENIGVASMTIFQCITLEGWVDVMYWAEESTLSSSSTIFFTAVVLFGSFIVLNLVIAVLSNEMSAEAAREIEATRDAELHKDKQWDQVVQTALAFMDNAPTAETKTSQRGAGNIEILVKSGHHIMTGGG